MSDVEKCFKCRWCPCVFSTEEDLASHLKAFGNYDHHEEWVRMHNRLERAGG